MRRYLAGTLALLLVLLGGPAYSLTLSEIRSAIRIQITDTDTNNPRWTDAQLNTIINQGQRDETAKTDLLMDVESISLTANTTCYNLPTDVIHIRRLTVANAPIKQTTINALDRDVSDWEDATAGEPTKYYIFQSTQVCFYPPPSTTYTARVFHSYMPAVLDDDSDEPFDGLDALTIYHDSLVWWTTWKVLMIERRMDEALVYGSMYMESVNQMRAVYNDQPAYTPPATGRERTQ